MAKVYEVAFQMGGQITSTFTKSMQGANSALGSLQNQIKSLNSQQGDLGNLQNLQKSVGTLSREFNKAQQNAQMLGKALSQTENPTKKQTQEFNKARTAAASLKSRLSEQRGELSKLRTSMGAAGKSTRDLVNDQKALAAQAEKARSAQAQLQSTMAKQQANKAVRSDKRGQLLDAAGLAASLAAPIKIAAQFQQKMAQVAAVSGASDEELKQLTSTARTLGATTNWSASQAAEGMEFLAMSGFSTQQSIKAMPGMLNLASAGAIDLGAAADIASNVLTGFNLKAEDTGRLGDVLTNAFTTSNVDLRMLGETMKYVAPVASATGVSLEQAAAMAGQLGNAGIQGSNAGTALRAVISRLSAPTGAAAKALQDLGIQTQDANGNLRSVPDILADMNGAMDGMGTAAKQGITSTIFGLEAASAATVLLGSAGSGELQKYTESLKKAGTAQKVAEKMNTTAIGSLKRLGSAVESIAITVGNVLLPPLASIAEFVAGAAGAIDAFAQKFPFITSLIVGTTAALVALKVASIAGGYAWTFVAGAGLKLRRIVDTVRVAYLLNTGAVNANTVASKKSLVINRLMIAGQTALAAVASKGGLMVLAKTAIPAAITAFKALSIAVLTNPIGLIIAGIAVAGLLIYKYWKPIKAFFSGFWDGLTEGLAPLQKELAGLMDNLGPLGEVFGFVWRQVKKVAGWFGSLFKQVDSSAESLAGAANAGKSFGGLVAAGVKLATLPIRSLLKIITFVAGAFGKLAMVFINGFKKITSYLSNTSLLQMGKDLISGYVSGVTALAFAPLNAVKAIGGKLHEWLTGFSLYDSGYKMLSTLADGIKAAVSAPVTAVKDALSKVRDYLPFSDAKVGPFSELTKSGAAIMSTLAEGVDSNNSLQGSVSNKLGATPVKPMSSQASSAANQSGGGEGSIVLKIDSISVSVGGGSGAEVEQQARAGISSGIKDAVKELENTLQQKRRLSYV